MASGIGGNFNFPGSFPIFAAAPGGVIGGANPALMQQQLSNGQMNFGATLMEGNETLQQAWKDVTGKNNGAPNPAGTDGNSSVANLSMENLQKLYGNSADDIKGLGAGQGLTVAQGRALAGSPETLTVVKDLMGKRSDIKLDDITTRGGAALNSMVKDPETREALAQRPDLKLNDLQEMKSQLKSTFKNPAIADWAYKKAISTLGDGGDVKPQELGKMFDQLAGATGTKKDGGATAVGMFDKARELLRSGKTPDDIKHLSEAAQNIGGGEGGSPSNVAQSFETAAKALQSRPDMQAKEVGQMSKSVAERFPSKDPQERMQAFQTGVKMMGQPGMDAKGIDTMLNRGKEQGLQGQKLLQSFETQGQAMREGALNVNTATDTGNKNLRFDKDGKLQREKTSSQASSDPKQQVKELGKADPKNPTPSNKDAKAGTPAKTEGDHKETGAPAAQKESGGAAPAGGAAPSGGAAPVAGGGAATKH